MDVNRALFLKNYSHFKNSATSHENAYYRRNFLHNARLTFIDSVLEREFYALLNKLLLATSRDVCEKLCSYMENRPKLKERLPRSRSGFYGFDNSDNALPFFKLRAFLRVRFLPDLVIPKELMPCFQ